MNPEIVFAWEFARISSPEVREFVLEAFDKLCPPYFWIAPASSSGKYHPTVSLGAGGIVRHTQIAVWNGVKLAEMVSDGPAVERVVAALLLHDLQKFGPEETFIDGRPTIKDITALHGALLADLLRRFLYVSPFGHDDIVDAVAGHMGRWTHPDFDHYWTYAYPLTRLVHTADYIASWRVENPTPVGHQLYGSQTIATRR